MRTISMAAAVMALGLGCPVTGGAQVSPQDSSFDSGGVQIRYVVRGAGPPVVLMHGFMVNTEVNWVGPGILDSLANHYTVVALDLRGHGASDKPHDPAAYGTALMDDIVRLLDHLAIERAQIVGYSMGALIALNFVVTHPERVVAAVLGGFGWRAPGLGPPEGVIQIRAQLERAALGEAMLADIIAASEAIDLPPPVKATLNRNDLAALKAVYAGNESLLNIPETALRANRIPILLIVGELDWARPDAEHMVDITSNAELEVLPGATHVTALTHPLLLDVIVPFLARH
jgi:pimeloyl-ACP methyl ester carboxylesterase